MSCCASCELQQELQRIGSSPLFSGGGWQVYSGLFDDATLSRLRAEAATLDWHADECPPGLDTETVRGGMPARSMQSSPGGPVQDSIYNHAGMAQFLAGEVGAPVRPCGVRATYSLYFGPQAHLDLHRDVPGCDLAVITCLQDSDPNADGGALALWCGDLLTPLDRLRGANSARGQGVIRLPLAPGDTLLLHGGVVPHCVPMLASGRGRVVSVMCFEMLA